MTALLPPVLAALGPNRQRAQFDRSTQRSEHFRYTWLVARDRERYRMARDGSRTTGEEYSMGEWQLDPYHTQVEFSAKHLGMMTVRGVFLDVAATGQVNPENPEFSSIEVTIQAAVSAPITSSATRTCGRQTSSPSTGSRRSGSPAPRSNPPPTTASP
jgi:hypothetical protein